MTSKTVAAMRSLIERAKENYSFVLFSRNLVGHHLGHDFYSEINTIFEFVRDEIRYVRDPFGIELVQSPMRSLQVLQGDCDDKTVIFCALAEAIGHRTRIVLESANGQGWSHVRADVFYKGQWIPADCTPETSVLGWTSPAVRKRGYPESKPKTQGLAGVTTYNQLADVDGIKSIGKAIGKGLKKASPFISMIPIVGTAISTGLDLIPSGNKDLEKKCSNPKNAGKKDCVEYANQKQQQQQALDSQKQQQQQQQDLQNKQMELLTKLASKDSNAVSSSSGLNGLTSNPIALGGIGLVIVVMVMSMSKK
jgi:hypothetical protein